MLAIAILYSDELYDDELEGNWKEPAVAQLKSYPDIFL
jgi:hypothetical protein